MDEIKDGRRFVDPINFTETDLPIIVLADDRRGFFGWGIKAHEHGNYNHAMIAHKPGYLVTQGFDSFKEVRITSYLDSGQMLKFWRIKNMSQGEINTISRNITRRISLPWYKKSYDWIGIFGQLIHVKFIQSPFQSFCSEQVRADYISPVDRSARLVPKEPSPSDLDRVFRTNPQVFECLGYFWVD